MNSEAAAYLEKLVSLLVEKQAQLLNLGITIDNPEVLAGQETGEAESVEIRLLIRRGGQIDDALEFQLIRAGRRIISDAEALAWTQKELEKLSVQP